MSVFACSDLAAEFLNRGKFLSATFKERVSLGEDLVFKADTSDVALLELLNESSGIVVVTISGITIKKNRNSCSVAHEFEDF